jgi:ribosomal protein S18 acetylase RimI-like enzyme
MRWFDLSSTQRRAVHDRAKQRRDHAMTRPHGPIERLDGAAVEPLRNGYFVLPRGKLANFCVYLEMPAPPVTPAEPLTPDGLTLVPLTGKDAARYQALFRAVGERWLWAGNIAKTQTQIAGMLDAPSWETWAVAGQPGDLGLLQIEYTAERGAELVYFGVVPEAIGQGLGRWLMELAMARAFSRPAHRLWLHTCNFDHPDALAFYRRAGFQIYATGFELMDDPRIAGILPPEAAPHVPLVG